MNCLFTEVKCLTVDENCPRAKVDSFGLWSRAVGQSVCPFDSTAHEDESMGGSSTFYEPLRTLEVKKSFWFIMTGFVKKD